MFGSKFDVVGIAEVEPLGGAGTGVALVGTALRNMLSIIGRMD